MNQAEKKHTQFSKVQRKSGGSDSSGLVRGSGRPATEAELFCKSDRLGLFDYQTQGLIKMTCVVRSSRAGPD